jgi:hypothetical protein
MFLMLMLSSKDQCHKVLSCFSLCLPLFFFGFFIFFLFHVSSLLFSFVFSFSLGFLELASIPAESSHYCWSSGRNSVFWLKYDIDLHPLPAAEWGCYGSWSLPYMLLPKVSEQLMLLFKLASQFCFCSFVLFCRVGFPLFLVC